MTAGFAGIKLANAMLASDTHNEEAFKLLKKSLTLLNKAGYNPTPETASRVYVHGLYNRGCYVFNNELYKYTANSMGPEKMAIEDDIFEGLALHSPEEIETKTELKQRVAEGLPFLEKAIELSTGTSDHGISQTEYLSAKGEMLHALSHMVVYTPQEREKVSHNEGSLAAFREALAVLEAIDPRDYTPQHLKLREKLSDTKIPHLCNHIHRPQGAQPLCQQLDERGRTLDTQMQQSGVLPVPDTQLEAAEKQKQQRLAAAQQRLSEARATQMKWLQNIIDKLSHETN